MKNDLQTDILKEKLEFEILPFVQKPERYVGGEAGTIIKNSYDVHACLVFADTYEIGMSNLGIRILYNALNEREDTLAELSFCPWPDMEQKLSDTGTPLYSHGTYTPLSHFDIIGISVPHEMCYTNILTILSLAGLPLKAEERAAGQYPLIIGGGAIAYNPAPVEDFFDLIVIGEGEEIIHSLIDTYRSVRSQNKQNKTELLRPFESLEGVLVSGSGKNVSRIYTHSLQEQKSIFPVTANTPPVHDRCVIEIARGCPWGCRFCQAGYVYRPYREKKKEEVVREAEASLQTRGNSEISFLSLSASDYRDLPDIIDHLHKSEDAEHLSINFPSMRINSSTLDILESVFTRKKPTITLAPEAGTERMLNIIGKKVSLEDFTDIATMIYRKGWQNIKLYFMIGLPFETEQDLRGIVRVINNISAARKSIDGRLARINVTISNFIPKPHTPFQWAAQNTAEEFQDKRHFIRKNIKNRYVKLKFSDPWQSVVEGMLSRGDKKTGRLIMKAWEKGVRFDNWSDLFRKDLWEKTMEECAVLPENYLKEQSEDNIFPWDNIHNFTNKDQLLKEWEKAKTYVDHP